MTRRSINRINEEAAILPTIGVGGVNNMGYSYQIYTQPQTDLSQSGNELCTDYYIQVGSKVIGNLYNNKERKCEGTVLRLIKDPRDGAVIALHVLSDETGRIKTVAVDDDLRLLIVKPIIAPPAYVITPNYTVNSGLY